MDHEKAKKTLCLFASKHTMSREQADAIIMAAEALEKEIPYKPTPCTVTLGRCKCGVGFMDKSTNYCGNCGQKLDWT